LGEDEGGREVSFEVEHLFERDRDGLEPDCWPPTFVFGVQDFP